MDEHHKSSAGTLVTVIVAVFMLYVLSPGPIALYYTTTKRIPPAWFEYYAYPFNKLCDHSKIVKSFYENYFKLIGVPP